MKIFCISKPIIAPLIAALLLMTTGSAAGMVNGNHQGETFAKQRPACAKKVSVHCGTAPSTRFDADGRLWVVFLQADHLYVSYSDDQGRHYATPVRVNETAEAIYADGENRPKIALGINNEIYLSWTQRTEERFSGNIRFSRSLDLGRSFSLPQTINDDSLVTSHRFDSLLVDQQGHLYMAWLDKRDRFRALQASQNYQGSAVYYAVSTDQGAHFSHNIKLADHSCECCRIATSEPKQGGIALFWRHIFKGMIRDHAFAQLSEQTVSISTTRATYDNWQVNACPHHGPALATLNDNRFAMTWFTNAPINKGIYFGVFDASSGKLIDQVSLTRSPGASHADLINKDNKQLFAVWKYFDGEQTTVVLRHSSDGGNHWQPEAELASSMGASDHPFLLKHGQALFLSWHTADEGLRLIQIVDQN